MYSLSRCLFLSQYPPPYCFHTHWFDDIQIYTRNLLNPRSSQPVLLIFLALFWKVIPNTVGLLYLWWKKASSTSPCTWLRCCDTPTIQLPGMSKTSMVGIETRYEIHIFLRKRILRLLEAVLWGVRFRHSRTKEEPRASSFGNRILKRPANVPMLLHHTQDLDWWLLVQMSLKTCLLIV